MAAIPLVKLSRRFVYYILALLSLAAVSSCRHAQVTALPKVEQPWCTKAAGIDLVYLPPGEFTAGSPVQTPFRSPSEKQRVLRLQQASWIGRYEVTWGQYLDIVAEAPPAFPRHHRNEPVVGITWSEAMDFCRRLDKQERRLGRVPEGYEYRLPTEAEWEYACRAGRKSDFEFSDVEAMAWYFEPNGVALRFPADVGQKMPNAWGIHDMLGNVFEYVLDAAGTPYSKEDELPRIRTTSQGRRIKGGSYASMITSCRCAYRGTDSRGFGDVGFRVILGPAWKDR